MEMATLDTVTHYINGEKVKGKNDRFGYVYSPSTGQKIATVPYASDEEVNETIQLAKKAAAKWAKTSVGKRDRKSVV